MCRDQNEIPDYRYSLFESELYRPTNLFSTTTQKCYSYITIYKYITAKKHPFIAPD